MFSRLGLRSHTDNGPPLLVTAAVDEISVRHPLQVEQDIAVKGQVVWTGKSSLDIRMQLFQVRSYIRIPFRTVQFSAPSSSCRCPNAQKSCRSSCAVFMLALATKLSTVVGEPREI